MALGPTVAPAVCWLFSLAVSPPSGRLCSLCGQNSCGHLHFLSYSAPPLPSPEKSVCSLPNSFRNIREPILNDLDEVARTALSQPVSVGWEAAWPGVARCGGGLTAPHTRRMGEGCPHVEKVRHHDQREAKRVSPIQ